MWKSLCSLVYKLVVCKTIANEDSLVPLHVNHARLFVALSEATGRISSVKWSWCCPWPWVIWVGKCFKNSLAFLEQRRTWKFWKVGGKRLCLYGLQQLGVFMAGAVAGALFCISVLACTSSPLPLLSFWWWWHPVGAPHEAGKEMGCGRCCWLRLCCCQFCVFI